MVKVIGFPPVFKRKNKKQNHFRMIDGIDKTRKKVFSPSLAAERDAGINSEIWCEIYHKTIDTLISFEDIHFKTAINAES